jgi:transcription antitermination protein NusB
MPREPQRDRATDRALRSAARLFAVQALFQMEASDIALDDVQREFETHRFGSEVDGVVWPDADFNLFRRVLRSALDHQARIDQMTDRALVEKWPIGRIDPTLRAIFRAAGAELIALETPPKVAITEYVDVARAFFPQGREASFVNAVLDHMARETRPEAFA